MAIENLGTGEAAYALLKAEYGYIGPESFMTILRNKKSGKPNALACIIVNWVLSWYYVPQGGKPKVKGYVRFRSRYLERLWGGVGERAMEEARSIVSRAGLITFHSKQNECWAEVHWDAVEAALARNREFVENLVESESRLPSKRESELSDSRQNGSLNRSDSRQNADITTYPFSSLNTPTYGGSAAAPARSGQEEGGGEEKENEPTARDALSRRVDALLERGRSLGRACTGKWAKEAHRAVREAMENGTTIDEIERAWAHYLNEVSDATRDKSARNATDLAHWLRGQNLKGEPVTGAGTFAAVRDELARKDARRQKEAEEARARAEAAAAPPGGERALRVQIRALAAAQGTAIPDGLDSMDVSELRAEVGRLARRARRR